MSKAPPELSWQDKAILIVIPIVVLIIFFAANYLTKDLTVQDAFSQRLPKVSVRDSGNITELIPSPKVATGATQVCRLRSKDSPHEFTFIYNVQGSETMNLEVGRYIQFFGEYRFDEKGGVLEVPYKGKSGRYSGWAVYENHRYYSHVDEEKGNL